MEDLQPPELRTRLLDRRATRRALLATGAAVAAGGTAAVVIGLANGSDGGKPGTSGSPAELAPTATSGPDLSKTIADPRQRAAHLLRRAGFGGTPAQVAEFAQLSREEAADRLLNYETIDNSALDARIATANFNLTTPGAIPGMGRLLVDMQRWWLTRMAYTARPLEERMTYIWHGLLTSQVSKVGGQRGKLLVQQNELFRANALGKYDTLLQAVSKDPAMMIYLDTIESTREHPNENYPREVMELFSMGVGNYTEEDIRESARAFTGWRLSAPPRVEIPPNLSKQEQQLLKDKAYGAYQPQFVFQARVHDGGQKTFLGKSGAFNGEDIIDIIVQQPATARYITSRLFNEFANYNPSDETIDRLVKVWTESGHDVKQVVRAILVSDEFYSLASYRAFVRAPVEFVVGAVRGLELETDFTGIERFASAMDQTLFEPPSVAGWPGGAAWLSSATFFGRANFLDAFLFQRGRSVPVTPLASAATPEAMVDEALTRLVDGNVTDASREALHAFAKTVAAPADRAAAVAYLVLASPEYQLT